MSTDLVKYELDNGDEIQLTGKNVRELLVNGDSARVTDKEVVNFMMLCKAHRLNPFVREAYLVKYGDHPATIVTGKDAVLKRAQRNPRFRGFTAGVTVINNGQIQRREGTLVLDGTEKLLGGWCRVSVQDFEHEMFEEVSLAEYSTGKSNWAKMPATMIRKVAIVHALREAFPEDLSGLYDSAEMGKVEEGDTGSMIDAKAEVIDVQNAEADPRKELWETAANFKREAIEAGIKEEGINQWMEATFVNADGTPKERALYTAEDIDKLACWLSDRINDMRKLAEKTEAAEDIEF